jgi:hypothetical protein
MKIEYKQSDTMGSEERKIMNGLSGGVSMDEIASPTDIMPQ